jgi:BlaI family transcriptional regulator, penicillinase repressor
MSSTFVEGDQTMKLTQAEWQIMKVLWKKYPATTRQIMTGLPKGVSWAYTTIKTMLSRLVEKNVVSEQMQGNTSLYEPLLSQRKARLSAFTSMLDQAFDGATGPLVHFLLEEQQLNPKQKQELIEKLKEDAAS